MSSRFLPRCLILLALLVAGLPTAAPAAAQAPTPPEAPLTDLTQVEQFWLDSYGDAEAQAMTGQWPMPLDGELLAKAQPDECFDGIGSPYPPGPACSSGKPKVNQAYVWGMTKVDNGIWFGTAANVLCFVLGGLMKPPVPHETESWVCEFGDSQFSPPLPAGLGDWRPPRIYRYDTASKALVEKSPPDARLGKTLGLRSVGALNNIVLLGGPAFGAGINLFAFKADTGAYLGSTTLAAYSNIRKWLVVDGVLYAGVRNLADSKGKILRWRGDLVNPFQFEEVGVIDADAAELALHEGRLFVSTWPDVGKSLAGLWMSPPIPTGGLTAANLNQWQKVWQVDQYEPDPVTAATYGGGALASYGGFLYWGTMHVPTAALLAHAAVYGPPADATEYLLTALATHRAVSIFRGRDFAATPQVELLYGNSLLPAYLGGQWVLAFNKMLAMPKYGLAGFNNFFNNYTWSMQVYGGQLFVGTMDWSYLFADILINVLHGAGLKAVDDDVFKLHLPPNFFGADLVRFPNVHHGAVPVSVAGVGNFTNYGIRNMLGDDALYIGTANPMNLLTRPHDLLPQGGWELIGLNPNLYPPLVGWVFLDTNGNGWRDPGEDAGVGAVRLSLAAYGHLAEYTKSVGSDGWYQFDQVIPGHYTVKALVPPEYIPTSPTTVDFVRWPLHNKVISFGVQRARATIGDTIWYDTNADGQKDADEFGVGGVTVALLADAAGAPGAVVSTATTDADGVYLFDWAVPGTYWVKVTDEAGVLAGHTLTTGLQSKPNPHGPVAVAHLGVYREADFGYVIVPGPGQVVISDMVWRDLDGDGVRDPGETGIAGVKVCAQPLAYRRTYCAVSNSHGMYHILAPAGTYLVAPDDPPAGLTPTSPVGSPGFYLPFVAEGGKSYLWVDFGYR